MPAKTHNEPQERTVPQKWRRIKTINATIDKLVAERVKLTEEVESEFARLKTPLGQ